MNPRKEVVLVGLIRLRQHCTFTWRQPEGGGPRCAEVRDTHCAECVTELRELGYRLVREDPAGR